MEKIQARDIEKIEEELYEIIDMLEELDAKRDTLRIGIIQSASEAVANAEITEEEDMFEDELDEATNHIRHALDIVGDKLPGLQRRLMRHPINPVYDAQLS